VTQYRSLEELGAGEGGREGFGLALGVFDGVHLGHQAVIEAARGEARTGVLTFEPHPIQVLAPDRAPRRILASLEHKERILADLGIDFLVVLEFSREFAAREAESFAKELTASGVQRLSAGDDWSFGRGRRGSMVRLAEWCPGVMVSPVKAVMQDGERISSTRIRQCLRDGNFDSASRMLGRKYTVFGEVVQGRQLGRTLEFPTANLQVAEEQLPPNGVYRVKGRWNDSWHLGVANVGVKPTVETQGRRSLEVHFLEGEVPASYGWMAEISFAEKLRDEMKFSSVEKLRDQIAIDVRQAQSAEKNKCS